jgi:hypothetical protein
LHAIGARFAGVFGQLPAIFAGRVTQDALQVTEHPAAWFRSGKARGDTSMHMAEGLCPAADIAGGRSRPKWGGMLGMLHDLLLLDGLLEVRLFSSSVSHEQVDVHEAFSGLLRLGNKCNCSEEEGFAKYCDKLLPASLLTIAHYAALIPYIVVLCLFH